MCSFPQGLALSAKWEVTFLVEAVDELALAVEDGAVQHHLFDVDLKRVRARGFRFGDGFARVPRARRRGRG
jgi:hypothetical protein